MSDLQRRSEQLFRSKGYLTASVEKRKRFPDPKRHPCKVCHARPMLDIASDLWNVFDLLCVRPVANDTGPARILIQVTDRSSHSKRRNKIIGSSEAKLALLSGFSILIQSWRKEDNRWRSQDEWITLDQFVSGLPNTAERFYEEQRKAKLDDLPPGTTLPLSDLRDSQMPF